MSKSAPLTHVPPRSILPCSPQSVCNCGKKRVEERPCKRSQLEIVHQHYASCAHQGSPIIGIGSPMVVVICRAAEALTLRGFCRWTMLTPQIADL